MKSIALIALLLTSVTCFAQIMHEQDLPQIKEKLQIEKDQAKRADLLNRAAVHYLGRDGSNKDLDSASLYCNASMTISRRLGLKKNIVQNLLLEGQIALKKGNSKLCSKMMHKALNYAHAYGLRNDEARVYRAMVMDMPDDDMLKNIASLKRAISLYEATGAKYDQGETYFELAGIYHNNGGSDSCIKYTKRAIKIKKSIKRNDLYKEYAILAQNFWTQGNYKGALHHALEAEKMAEDQNADGEWLNLIYNLLAVMHSELYDNNSSIAYYKKAIAVARENNDAYGLEAATLNAVMSLYNKGDFDEALQFLDANYSYSSQDCNVKYSAIYLLLYCEVKKYDKARSYYDQLLRCSGKASITEQKSMYSAMIQYLLKTGQAGKSYPYLDKLRALTGTNQDPFYLREIELTHFEVDSATGNQTGAMKHFINYKSLSDSIFNASSAEQFADLQVKYETDKKVKDIRLLTQQGKLQDEKIRNAGILRYVFLICLAILAVFVGLLYNRSRIKQRTNETLQLSQEKINEQNDELKELLSEKEWLLKEIHHRVKNNLQIVISLLNAQSAQLENKDALMAIQNSQHRMHAMSLIHQKLYQSDSLSTIDMSWYISELVHYLNEGFEASGRRIRYNLDTEPVELDATQAIPLGLILNEAISNALKYAFTGRSSGKVSISLKAAANDTYRLEIADDGVGLPEGFESIERESLGMDLMIGLTDQLDGTFELQNKDGLAIIVTITKKRSPSGHHHHLTDEIMNQ